MVTAGTRDAGLSIRPNAMVTVAAIASLAVATVVGLYSLPKAGYSSQLDIETGLTFVVLAVLTLAALLVEMARRPYSLHFMHLVSFYMLLVAAPLYQTWVGYFPLPRFEKLSSDLIVQTNLVSFTWIVSYLVAYEISASVLKHRSIKGRILLRKVQPSGIYLSVMLSFAAFVLLAALGLTGELTRGGAFEAVGVISSPVMLIIKIFGRGLPVIGLGAVFLALRHFGPRYRLFMAMAAIPLIVGNMFFNNPIAAPRYWTVTVLLGWFAPHFLRNRRTAAPLLIGMILAMVVLPGLGGEGRHARSADEVLNSLRQIVSPATYLTYNGDFAEYPCLAQSLVWTRKFELQGGRQLLGGLFFFVPRSVWPEKPVGTGAFVARQMNFEFDNVASSIVAEPLVDFGWFGVPVYAAIFALILAYLDTVAWRRPRERLTVIDFLYPFLVGAIFIMTRGDFLVSYSLIMGLLVATLPLLVGSKPAGSSVAGSTPSFREGAGIPSGDGLRLENFPRS